MPIVFGGQSAGIIKMNFVQRMKMLFGKNYFVSPVDAAAAYDANVEILTDAKFAQIAHPTNPANMVWINLDTNKWNTDNYLGYKISDQNIDTKYAKVLRNMLRNNLHGQDVVAFCIMAIGADKYTKMGGFIENPEFDANGTAVVANVATRDATGNIGPMSNKWIAVATYDNKFRVARDGMYGFLNLANNITEFYASVMKLLQNEK